MRILLNRYFLGLLVLGACIYFLQRFEVELPTFIQNYVNDLLVMPLVLWIVLAVLVQIKGAEAQLSWMTAWSLFVYYSVFFEYYLPTVNIRYTSDLYDVFCYFIGTMVFMFLYKKGCIKI
ncbi:hypothetical protein [Flavobacterium sp. HSC-61S13]|uniref:hypothetical protein n=1 Tax=Flavobacterium sp. HSC-61S13 TaxID=2910963 RepID=UPI00209D0AEF|nr:hypothetical protein [Flavobacterium sp. HSC-61S13]MCP1994831.1 hypothetical protein [Flavobacterium sp. HSC-61S13]